MKVLFVTSTFLKSKKDEQLDFVYEVATAFERNGHKVMVLAAHCSNACKEHEIDGVKIRRFQYWWPVSMQKIAYGCGIAQNIKGSLLAKAQFVPYILSNAFALRKAVREFEPDVVQVLWAFPQGWAALIALHFCNFCFALHLFGAEIYLSKKIGLPFLASFPTKFAKLLTSNSVATHDAAVGIGAREHDVLFCGGVNTKRYNEKVVGRNFLKRPVIFVMGRLVERKGHVYLVKAMPEILKKCPNALLVIGGGGPEEFKIKSVVDELGLSKSVYLAGRIPIPDLPSYYAGADVFCLPAIVDSKGETEGGQGLVIGEAMACGVPVVSCNVGGIPDVVKNGINGLLVPQKDSSALAKAVCRILSDKDLASTLSKAGIETVKNDLSYDIFVKKMVKKYKETLK